MSTLAFTTLPFEDFWSWLQQHPNCIVRAGSENAVLYDDDDLHWYVGLDGEELVVQLVRGKRLTAELVIDPRRVTYVQDAGEEREGEHLFEAISETPTDRIAAYQFVLAHGLEEQETSAHRPAVH